MAKNETLDVTYLRKDTQFLKDGVWYVSAICPALVAGGACLARKPEEVDAANGVVDEAVRWEDAKTPHHAGLIADRRHAACGEVLDLERMRQAGQQEIDAAEAQVQDQKRNVERWRARVAEIQPLVEGKLKVSARDRRHLAATLEHAAAQLKRHEEAIVHAVRRAAEIRKHNTPA